jgi:hypothetical protein
VTFRFAQVLLFVVLLVAAGCGSGETTNDEVAKDAKDMLKKSEGAPTYPPDNDVAAGPPRGTNPAAASGQQQYGKRPGG